MKNYHMNMILKEGLKKNRFYLYFQLTSDNIQKSIEFWILKELTSALKTKSETIRK